MTLVSILLNVSAIICIVLILFFIRIFINDLKVIKARSVQFTKLENIDKQSGVPITLHRENWAQFEGAVPNLKEVILLLDKLDMPSGALYEAIQKNLTRRVKYYFYVSSPKNNRDIESFTHLFKGIVDSVITREGFEFGSEELFKIVPLKISWNNVPYVFYRLTDPELASNEEKGYAKTVGFRGDIEGVGIAGQYTIINGYDAEAITKLLSEAITDEHKPIFHGLREGEFVEPRKAIEIVNGVVKPQRGSLRVINS